MSVALVVSAVAALGLGFPSAALGIGQITKPIVILNALRGHEAVETITVLNSADEAAVYLLSAEGDIADWAEFYEVGDELFERPITKITAPPKSYFDATVKFKVPDDAPNGTYRGEIVVKTAPPEESGSEGASVAVRLKVGREVTITVVDREIINMAVSVIPETYDVPAGEPLNIRLIYDNRGNVSVRPDVSFKITQADGTVFNAVFPYPEDEPAVKPGEIKEVPGISWHTGGRRNGAYTAELEFLVGGEAVHKEDFRFTVGLHNGGFLLASLAALGGGNMALAWLLIGGLFAALVAAGAIGLKARTRRLRARA
jgi:uncharacterized membrane protein